MGKTEYIVWGRRPSDPEWCETILYTQATNRQQAEHVVKLAQRDGWTAIRIAEHIEGEKPDFAKTVR